LAKVDVSPRIGRVRTASAAPPAFLETSSINVAPPFYVNCPPSEQDCDEWAFSCDEPACTTDFSLYVYLSRDIKIARQSVPTYRLKSVLLTD